MTPIFNKSWEYPLVYVWSKFGDSWKLKYVTSYRADKVKFTDGRTDRRTDTGNGNTTSAWKAKGKMLPLSIITFEQHLFTRAYKGIKCVFNFAQKVLTKALLSRLFSDDTFP